LVKYGSFEQENKNIKHIQGTISRLQL